MTSISTAKRYKRAGGAGKALLATATVAALVGGAFFSSAASARPDKKHKAAPVVKEVMRKPYGKILTTAKKLTLYVQQTGTCTGSCLTIWPPLLLPSGETVPTGAPDLGTVSMSEGLQVTYNSMPLYTFYTDSKKSVNGEGQGGFVVAQVAPAARVVAAKTPKPTVVVAETNRPPFGEILTNKKSRTLYVLTGGGTCTASCLKVWPPLLMPKGKTMPAGASGLGTVAFGAKRLQVTYNSSALYTFTGDSGTSATGNGEAGFVVAQVSS
jgi:predicted lipoprotein with Yx(FWY)xxD motif